MAGRLLFCSRWCDSAPVGAAVVASWEESGQQVPVRSRLTETARAGACSVASLPAKGRAPGTVVGRRYVSARGGAANGTRVDRSVPLSTTHGASRLGTQAPTPARRAPLLARSVPPRSRDATSWPRQPSDSYPGPRQSSAWRQLGGVSDHGMTYAADGRRRRRDRSYPQGPSSTCNAPLPLIPLHRLRYDHR